jgi:hypothetical protein
MRRNSAPKGPDVPYKVEMSTELNEAGVRSCAVTLHPSEDDPLEIHVSGSCPMCEEPLSHVEPLVVVRGADHGVNPAAARAVLAALRSVGMPLREQDVEVICGCRTTHPGAPVGVTGCGRSWTLHVEWGDL